MLSKLNFHFYLFETLETLGKVLRISAKLVLAMIDGKVFFIITDGSAVRCPICKASATIMNDYDHFLSIKDQIPPENHEHGLSDLHLLIHGLDMFLELSYKKVLPGNQFQVRGDQNKLLVEERTRLIRERLKDEMGILITGKNSITGNVARRAFENVEKLSECLEIERELIERFKIEYLAAISLRRIDTVKFRSHCRETLRLYNRLYGKFPLPPTIHKFWFHAADAIESVDLPIAYFTEQAAESKNKFTRRHREERARKDTAEHNLMDVFNRAMDESSIVMSTIIKKQIHKRKPRELPVEVLELLLPFDPEDDDDDDDENE